MICEAFRMMKFPIFLISVVMIKVITSILSHRVTLISDVDTTKMNQKKIRMTIIVRSNSYHTCSLIYSQQTDYKYLLQNNYILFYILVHKILADREHCSFLRNIQCTLIEKTVFQNWNFFYKYFKLCLYTISKKQRKIWLPVHVLFISRKPVQHRVELVDLYKKIYLLLNIYNKDTFIWILI